MHLHILLSFKSHDNQAIEISESDVQVSFKMSVRVCARRTFPGPVVLRAYDRTISKLDVGAIDCACHVRYPRELEHFVHCHLHVFFGRWTDEERTKGHY